MSKIKYQGGITKLICGAIAKKNKSTFSKYINQNLTNVSKKINRKNKKVGISLVSFSSSRDYYDQILSILSFLRFVGTPSSWTIYSDGTHTSKEIELLIHSFDFVTIKVKDLENEDDLVDLCKGKLLPYAKHLIHYARKLPLGKKLLFYLNHPIKNPCLFLDADVLFYSRASIIEKLDEERINGWYLPDGDWGGLDSRYKTKHERQLYQVNSGCFLLNKELINLHEGLDFLKSLDFVYEYFSEQTIFHILFRSNNFMPLDPRIFILNSSDQFDFSYSFSKKVIALRHYTGPVRHKMWQRDWKWHLSINY